MLNLCFPSLFFFSYFEKLFSKSVLVFANPKICLALLFSSSWYWFPFLYVIPLPSPPTPRARKKKKIHHNNNTQKSKKTHCPLVFTTVTMVIKILIWILWFYDPACPKRFRSFKNLCDRLGSVRSYNSNDPKRSWFLVIFFNLTKGLVGPK